MNDLASEILKNITEESVTSSKIVFKNITSSDINKTNFHIIPNNKSNGKIAFIDGGNAEILASSAFSLHIIRIIALVYEQNKRIQIKKKEFKVLTTIDKDEYVTKSFPKEAFKETRFKINDPNLKTGNDNVSISKIGSLIRRLAELEMAKNLTNDAELIILDGSLETKYQEERVYLDKLQEVIKDTALIAISKTCNIITNKGNSITALLKNIKSDKWYYDPNIKKQDKDYNAQLYFIKLHEKSDYVFRMDLFRGEINQILPLLTINSKDPVFLGYPYGLIEADKLARISNKEADLIKTQLMVNFGKDWNKIKPSLNSVNAHQILDNIG